MRLTKRLADEVIRKLPRPTEHKSSKEEIKYLIHKFLEKELDKDEYKLWLENDLPRKWFREATMVYLKCGENKRLYGCEPIRLPAYLWNGSAPVIEVDSNEPLAELYFKDRDFNWTLRFDSVNTVEQAVKTWPETKETFEKVLGVKF